MTTENLNIVITADVQDAVNKVKAVKNQVTDLNKNSGIGNLKGSFSQSADAAADLSEQLESIKNMNFAQLVASFAKLGAEFRSYKEDMAEFKDMAATAQAFMDPDSWVYNGDNSFLDWEGEQEAMENFKAHMAEANVHMDSAKGRAGGLFHAISNGALKAAAAIGAVVAAIAAMVAAIKTAINVSSRLRTEFFEARKVGLTTAAYQEWAYVLGQVGVGADKLSDFIKSLSAAQNDLRDGSEPMVEAFKALGLSIEEATRMTQEELFVETIKRLQQMEDGIKRTGIAYRIFGEDDAAEVANLLALNNAEMERMINNFYLLGGSASDSAIQKSLTLQGSISSLKLAWQGFANTIGEAVMPALTAIVNGLTKAVVAINMFLRAVFGFSIVSKGSKTSLDGASASIGGYTEGLNAATGAAEKLKRTTQGFDELNIVQNPQAGGGSGGGTGAGGGGGSIDIPEMNIEGLTQDLGLEEMAKWFEENAETIQKWTKRVVAATAAWKLFTTAVKLFTGKKFTLGTLVAGIPKLLTGLKNLITNLTKGKGLMAAFTAAFPKLASVVAKVTSGFTAAVKAVGAFLGGLSAGTIAAIIAIIAALASAVYFCVQNWDELVRATKNWFALNIAPKLKEIGNLFVKLWEALVSVWEALVNVASVIWDALPDGVKEWLAKAAAAVRDVVKAIGEWFASIDWLKAIGTAFEWLGGLVVGILGGVIGGAINGVIQLILGAVEIITGIVQTISGLVTGLINLIVGLFTGDFSKALDSAKQIWDGIVLVFKGAYDATIGVVIEFVKGIINWFTELWDVLVGHSIVPDMIDAIILWFKKLPGQLFSLVANFVSTVINYFIDLATRAGQWAGTMWEKIKTPFTGVAGWFKGIFQQAWNAITSVWNNVTSFFSGVWNTIKGIFSNVGTSIASGVVGAVKGAVNSVLRTVVNKINTFIGWINSAIGLINKIPGVNIGRIGTLSVPQLAKGGIVTDSILANIGERGKEAVLPLENNTGWMDALADRIAARNGSTRVVLQVDGRELGWATIEQINAITKQTGGLQLVL